MPVATKTQADVETVGEIVDNLPAPATASLPATQAPVENTIFSIIERAARDPAVDIEKLERLMGMQERMLARQAEVEFDNAMSAAQREMQPIRNDSNNPSTRSKYASYAVLDSAIRPIYARHGFSLSFDTADGATPDHVRVVCKVAHIGGHRERPRIDMPADGKGAKGGDVMTKTHAMGSAVTYGKRYLLSMVFNLATTNDDDGNAAGGRARSSPTDWTDDARKDGLIKGDETRSQYTVDKLKAARAGGWVVVNKTAKGQRDQISDYLDMAETPDDIASILNHNEQVIANSGDRAQIETHADTLLRWMESQTKNGAAAQ